MKAFQCLHSGLYYPGDYYKKWGIDYGIGQGPDPVSEILNSAEHLPKAAAFSKDSGILMYPVGVTHAPVQMVEVSEEEFAKNAAILHKDDVQMTKRIEILVAKQKAKALALAETTFSTAKAGLR